MSLLKQKDMWRCALITCFLLRLATASVGGNVVLIGRNVSYSFQDVEANFAPSIKKSGDYGVLYVAEPLDACDPLINKVDPDIDSPFVLIIRGGCTFDAKVRSAQNAGFKAAIVYDDEERETLISMAGSSIGIHIYAVFVAKTSGEILKKYAGRTDLELWIIPTFETSAWSIMVISLISLLIMSAVLATCFLVRSPHLNHEHTRVSNVHEFHGMSSKLVKAMPSLIFTSVVEDNCTSTTCAICLEDYIVGEKLRILPCRHKFHALCVDAWLTTWRSFCPVCKQDAMEGMANPPASECTPLLSSGVATPPSNVGWSSFHSSLAASPIIQRTSMPPISLSNPRSQSFRSPPIQIPPSPCQSQSSSFSSARTPTLRRSYGHSPILSTSRSSADLINASIRRSHSYLVTVHSSGLPMPPSINSRLASSFVPSSSIGSPNYFAASSSQQSYLRHRSESGSSLSALASAQSLPEC